ncbi:MAG: MATE family efflux transporter [Rubricella sp.]
MATRQARFTTGSTMRHVVVMTLTGSLGLTFMFLVDFATLFWVSRLGEESYIAAVGFAWVIQFFTISAGIGLAIAATALVSRAIGQEDWHRARCEATGAMTLTVIVQAVVAALVLAFRDPLLALLGAEGYTAEVASRFLLLSVPALPVMALGMAAGAILRAAGDAWRSMLVTLSAGLIAMVIDPFLILEGEVMGVTLGLGLGVDGAALGTAMSRIATGALGLWFVVRIHDLAVKPTVRDVRAILQPFARIAAPAIATQLSTPFGNFVLTALIAPFGDDAVAGWSVVSRLTVLAFGGIFALSGAIGGIIGQNYGAALMERVRCTYRDALIFCALYTLAAWMLLALGAGWIAGVFGVDGTGADVVLAFGRVAAGAFVFTGAIFVANAAFNNLGRPLWSTGVNWLRDGVVIWPVSALMAGSFAAPGVVYGQALAGVIVGILATIIAWRFIARLDPPRCPTVPLPADPGAPTSAENP